MNIADTLRNHAHRRPHHAAVVARDRMVSYAQFDAGVDSAALMLHEVGIRQGDAVGVALGDTPEHLAFLLAVARLGAIILPMDRRWTSGEKTRIAEHFGAKLVLIEPDDDDLAPLRTLRLER